MDSTIEVVSNPVIYLLKELTGPLKNLIRQKQIESEAKCCNLELDNARLRVEIGIIKEQQLSLQRGSQRTQPVQQTRQEITDLLNRNIGSDSPLVAPNDVFND